MVHLRSRVVGESKEDEPAASAQDAQPSPLAKGQAQRWAGDADSCSSGDEAGPLDDLTSSLLAALQSVDVVGPHTVQGVALAAPPAQGAASGIQAEAGRVKWAPDSGLPTPVPDPGNAILHLESRLRSQAHSAKQLLNPLPGRRGGGPGPSQPKAAAAAWFELPVQRITPELKRDLRLLRLRGALDPQRFYKAPDATKFPERFHIGTVMEGPAEFYSGRLTRRERKATITEELLSDTRLGAVRKKRYAALQAKHDTCGLVGKRKTERERLKKRGNRPKH